MASSTVPTRAQTEVRLASLRDNPVNTADAGENILGPIYQYLMAIPADSSDGNVHWFCAKADSVTTGAATFLIRLFAYSSNLVHGWQKRLEICLTGCAACVQVFFEVKSTSRHTYFGAFPDEVIEGFYKIVDGLELRMVTAALSLAGISLDQLDTVQQSALADVPPAVVYHMLFNLSILRDSRILTLIRSHPLPARLPGWPTDIPPPGLLLLMVDKAVTVRKWASNQVSKFIIAPIPKERFVGPFVEALEAVAKTFTEYSNASSSATLTIPNSINYFLPASDTADLWAGFDVVLRFVPLELLRSNSLAKVNLRRVIIGHLHDTGSHFPGVLKCLILLLKRIGADLWQGEEPEHAQIVFDSVKDNPSYAKLLRDMDPSAEPPWSLTWFSEYLHTIQGIPAYTEVLAKMVDFMCEELQHERFKDTRPVIMVAVSRLLAAALAKSNTAELSHHHSAIKNTLDIHADRFIAVAFARSHNDLKWQGARAKARGLLAGVFDSDTQDILDTISSLCKRLAGSTKTPIHIPTIRRQMWDKVYETLQANDADGLRAIIAVVARAAHLARYSKKPFEPAFDPLKGSTDAETALDEVNLSLDAIHRGFVDALSKYSDYNVSSLLDLLRQPGVVKDILLLMFSPVDDLQTAAQNLVGQAFDVDVRLDCFRALLENLSQESLEGIFDFLNAFIKYAPAVPEACDLSKSLVRCLTDIIEVLCASHDGLLRSPTFLKSEGGIGLTAKLPTFWSLMAKSIAVIFKRTPLWSTYFESEDMIVWMRDALIFGRDMLAQRRVIEIAAVDDSNQPSPLHSPRKLSRVGTKMVKDLQEVLPELARWLRLTDEELLHQSFSLLQSLLEAFRESGIPPSPAGIAKLNKHIDDARKKDPTRPQTRLDSSRLSQLENALASFDGDDDIIVVSSTIAPKREAPKEQDSKSKTKPVPMVKKPGLEVVAKKPSISDPQPSSSKSSISHYFKKGDQQSLATQVPTASFKRMDLKPSTITKSSISLPAGRIPKWPKDEGSSRTTPVEESSSDSESDGGQEDQGGLASLGKLQRSPKIRKQPERRQVKMLSVPVKSQQDRVARRDDARRTALRLKPDISGLHRALLSWNYDHDGPDPPTSETKPTLLRVPDEFTDHSQYLRVFEPLLLLECWSQIVQSKDQTQESYEAKITSKQFTDDWLDFDVSISGSVKKDWYLSETDVVLIRHLDRKGCILAKVRSYLARPWGIQASLRCLVGGSNVDPGLHIESRWRISKVFSLSTINREYAALMALPYYDLFNTVLRPRLFKDDAVNHNEIKRIMATYRVNEPQAIAISSSLKAKGFALIQGPPGTGKTSTICGLVEAVLSTRPQPATSFQAGRNGQQVDKGPSKKILLCAPSNAAIDEVAYRMKRGPHKSKVVRVGADKTINIAVKDISLDALIEKKMSSEKITTNDSSNAITALREEIEAVKRTKQEKIEELSNVRDNAARTLALQNEIRKLSSQKMSLSSNFDKLKDKQKSDARSLDATRRKFRADILSEADIICSTLSGAGHELLEHFEYDMLIIDEAAQAIELSSLIPLRYSCRSCIMVGDPQQLPPTVLSHEASKLQYSQSLFVRLQRHQPDAVHLLSIQYRMHPDISQLPSRIFYQGRLQDGPSMAEKTKQPWHSHAKFGTYRFFNISLGQEEQTQGHSLKNVSECRVAVSLFARLRQEFSSIDVGVRVGVVSMYSAQVAEMRRMFQQRFGPEIVEIVDFNTVDGFQGQEKDIIILSCVRAGPGLQTVGFLKDTRRMNVALTRAKSSLFILGNVATLERSDDTWRNIVQDSRARSFLTDADVTYFNAPKDHVRRPPSPQKTTKTLPQLPAIPANLSTPREIKAAVDQRASTVPKLTRTDVDGPPDESPPKIIEENRGQKRALDTLEDTRTPATTSITGAPNAVVRPPPPKRPKQASSIFIPKRKKPPA